MSQFPKNVNAKTNRVLVRIKAKVLVDTYKL